MDSITKGLLRLYTPSLASKRFRGKINIQKPRKPHFARQLLIDFTKPVFAPRASSLPEIQKCDINKKKLVKKLENPFERILANECLNWFNTSKMVVFLHLNSIPMSEKMPIFVSLKKNDMHLRVYGKKIMSMATTGTRYEAVNHLFTSHQNIIFGQPEKAAKMFQILKKAPQLIVMGGIIQDKLLSKNELVEYSNLPSIEVALSQFCAQLESAASHLVTNLSISQQNLVSHLDKHVELQTSSEEN